MMTENNDSIKPIDLAVEVSKRVELSDVHLVRCMSELLSFPTEKDNIHEVTGFANANIDAENNTIFIIVHFNLFTANEHNVELARVEAEFLLVYKAKSLDGLAESNYDAFADYNGVFNAWPYWREFVNNMTTSMVRHSGQMGTAYYGGYHGKILLNDPQAIGFFFMELYYLLK